MVNINIAISDDLHKRLRIAAAEQGLSQKELIISYLEDFAKQAKHR